MDAHAHASADACGPIIGTAAVAEEPPLQKAACLFAALAALLGPGTSWVMPAALGAAGAASAVEAAWWDKRGGGGVRLTSAPPPADAAADVPLRPAAAGGLVALWAGLLLALSAWGVAGGAPWPVELLGIFFRAGSLAYGGWCKCRLASIGAAHHEPAWWLPRLS